MDFIIKNKKYLINFLAILSLLVSLYLTLLNFQGKGLQCGLNGCDKVLSSSYSYFLKIPVSFWGVIYFSSVLILNFLNKINLLKFVSTLGFLFSSYLSFLQFFIIKTLCPFCLIADLSAILIFLLIFAIK